MFDSNFDKLVDTLFAKDSFEAPFYEKNYSTTYVPSKFSVDVNEDRAVMALNVLGHDADDIDINCYEDKIEVKSNKELSEKVPYNNLVSKIDERITIGKNFDGRDAKAVIKNGILTITLERKEETKPKKV